MHKITMKGAEKMKKLFISQPMNGKTDEQILIERENAVKIAKEILGEDVAVIDTFYTDDANPLGYLARSISGLAKADVAYFTNGWQNARGCKIEHECAAEYGIQIISAIDLKN